MYQELEVDLENGEVGVITIEVNEKEMRELSWKGENFFCKNNCKQNEFQTHQEQPLKSNFNPVYD